MYAAYDNAIAETFEDSTPDTVDRLAKLLETHDFFGGARVYIDSFTGFTAPEYAVLRAILRQASEVTVTLSADREDSRNPAFLGVCDTARRLRLLCEREHIPVEVVTLTENYRTDSPELRLLERGLWDFTITAQTRPDVPPEARGALTLMRATNLYAEAEAVALRILDLVHHGTAYGEIAVVFRDSDTYRGVIDAALERHGIPFYFSEKTSLAEQPLARLIFSSLRAVCRGYQQQDVLAILKTGLFPVDAADADLFEQYVATWQITGRGFTAGAWTRNPDGYTDQLSPRGEQILAAANRVREALMTPLSALGAALGRAEHLPALCCAVYDYLCALDIPALCAARAEAELAGGYVKEAGETLRVFDTVLLTLTQISARLPELALTPDEFAAALQPVFAQTQIASVPSLHDSVILGSADTLRVENIAVSFVLGVNEGEFPRAAVDSGLLTEADRRVLSESGLSLSGESELQSANELLFLYRAMTKPSRRLFVSTLRAATDGSAKAPSVAYARLLFLFPYLKDAIWDFDLSMLPTAHDRATAGQTETLPSAMAEALFGNTLRLTQSRIQTFVRCPYSFYCQYRLALRERKTARVEYTDSGIFLHFVLEQFLRRLTDGGDGQLRLPDPNQIEPMTDEIVNAYLRRLIDTTGADMVTLHIFRRLRALTLILLRDILNELTHSRFLPHDFEVRIGGGGAGDLPPYEITLADGKRILLGGVVDRVDIYRRDDRIYLRVIDYKSGAKAFSLDDIRQGLNIQLLLYLFALCRPSGAQPAGVLYLATAGSGENPTPERSGLLLDDPDVLLAMNDEADPHYLAGVKQDRNHDFRGRALISADGLHSLEGELCDILRTIGERMFRGYADRTPSEDACRFCPLCSSCPDAIRAAR